MRGDANGDGIFTISDIWIYIEYLACFPGNLLMRALALSKAGPFLELDIRTVEYSGWAWTISVLAWIALLGVIGSLLDRPKQKK